MTIPEEINLGTGKKSSYGIDVPLSDKQIAKAKDGSQHIGELRVPTIF